MMGAYGETRALSVGSGVRKVIGKDTGENSRPDDSPRGICFFFDTVQSNVSCLTGHRAYLEHKA